MLLRLSNRIRQTRAITTLCLVLVATTLSDGHAQTRKSQTQTRTPASNADSKKKPAIVAVVNGKQILRQQLAAQCLSRYGETVLESLVNRYLIFQECKRRGIKVTTREIDEEIASIASKFNISTDRWIELLKSERQISAEQYRRDIIWPTLALKRLVADKLSVSEAEIQKAFESEYGPKVRVRMISALSRPEAEKILAEVKANPKDFGKIAKNKSQDANSAAARGLIPPIRKHAGDANIEKIAFAMKPGEISDIIPFANQFIILQCEDHIPATKISKEYENVARQRLKDRLLDNQLRQQAELLSRQLQENAKVVNVMGDDKLRKQYPGVAALINGQKISLAELAEECIARHGVDVLESEINFTLLQQALQRSGKKVTKQQLTEEVDRVAKTFNKSRKEWLDTITKQENMSVNVYIRDAVWPTVALKNLVEGQVQVTDEDIRKGFEANYGVGIEVLAIVLGNQRTAQEVWEMARSNPTKSYFGQLASEYSIEPVSRANMGEVPPIRRFSGQELVEKEAFSLNEKDPLSSIVAIGDRYIIMYYLGKTKPVVTELDDEIRGEPRREIHEKKLRLEMAKEYDRLRQIAKIDNFLTGTSQQGIAATSGQPARTSPKLIRPASTNGRSLNR